jgi:hypothetical protein
VAACDLQEALAQMRKWHSVDILRVELVGLIEMVSGSPLNRTDVDALEAGTFGYRQNY